MRTTISKFRRDGFETMIPYHGALLYFNTADSYQSGLAKIGYYELLGGKCPDNLLETALQQLRPVSNPVVVDIGSNVGAFCLPLAKALPNSLLYAVEPHPLASSRLLQNIALNEQDNVVYINAAISNTGGIVHMFSHPTNSGGHRLTPLANREDLSGYRVGCFYVPSTPLSEVFKQLKIQFCDLLKIDVEGLEYNVLLSMGEHLSTDKVGAIVVEYGTEGLRAAGAHISDIFDLLTDKGYSHCTLIETGAKIAAADDLPILPDFQVLNLLFAPDAIA